MGKLTYSRNTTYGIQHTYQKNGVNSTDGVTLFFTVKATQNDSDAGDSTAIISKTIAMSGAVTSFTIDPPDVADTVNPGKYFYDFKVKEAGTSPLVIHQCDSGTFILEAEPTNRES